METKNKNIRQDEKKETAESRWIGDKISEKKLDKVQKLMGLTKEQMDEAVQNAKKEWIEKQQNDDDLDHFLKTTSLAEKMNTFVYIGLFAAFLYFVNRDYNGIIKIMFIKYFPKESKVFGLI